VDGLFCHATRALCESVGFRRAAVFSLRGGALVAESMYQRDLNGHTPVARFELGPGLRETEALRRRVAILVPDVAGDARAVGLLPGAGSFVAAPIMCEDHAVGLIHADGGPGGEAVTELDRDALAVFAEGFGYAVERCVLFERLRLHSERVLALARSTEASVGALGGSGLGLRGSALRAPAPIHVGNGLDSLLTRRELEVVAMLAEGETNASIARRLVVSEDTVKSHVKHILRKLGVHNRSQAVSRYFQARAAS
jgi:LuxR family transcriptional regulator, regulator of acetate metabolism